MKGIHRVFCNFFLIFYCISYISYAHANFRVCNTTQNTVGVAIGYREKNGWKTEGWWYIDRLSCTTVLEEPLESRYYYLYAEDAERGARWGGSINMCVGENEFTIQGVSNCIARGYQKAGFQEHDTLDKTSWMVQLTDNTNTENTTVEKSFPSRSTVNP